MKHTGGGRFEPDEPFVFFLAGASSFRGTNAALLYDHLLVAVPDEFGKGTLERLLDPGSCKLFLDSGIFTLTMAHARAHGVHMDDALGLSPDVIDGFDTLLGQYIDTVRTYQDRLWGYVELDQGGLDNKRKTRAYLEDEGLRPIPVYHPLNDGWDYLDELADEYDRICVGNVVWGSSTLRRDMLFTINERLRRKKRQPWVHVLGHTPNPLFLAVPFNSADSTTHLYSLRFGSRVTFGRSMLAQFSRLADPGYSYDRTVGARDVEADALRGQAKVSDFLCWIAHADLRHWRLAWADLEAELGEQPTYPPPVKGERAPVRR